MALVLPSDNLFSNVDYADFDLDNIDKLSLTMLLIVLLQFFCQGNADDIDDVRILLRNIDNINN